MTSWTASELDHSLVGVLEVRPRAEWASAAAVLGVASTTVARHWHELVRRGAAWVTAAPGPQLAGQEACALVLLAVVPTKRAAVAAALQHDPAAGTVSTVEGAWDFLVDTFETSGLALTAAVDRFAGLPGVQRTEVVHLVAAHRDGSHWRSGTISAGQTSSVAAGSPGAVWPAPTSPDATDRALLSRLTLDGRTSLADLADSCHTSPQTVGRRLQRLIGSGYAALRCDTAQPLRRPHREVTLLLNVPLAQIDAATAFLATLPECRLVAEVLGEQNLFATMWVRDYEQLKTRERELGRAAPGTMVRARLAIGGTVKRSGQLLGEQEHRVGTVPMAIWPAP
ncbi:AsnC family transcriptional regulator [Branchiibius cervicis]|uniref:AsnC family transcriptional regulator n=1 Tax=Branchiibius cervicis TaxID=908252 RepID=A0ABW2AV42_9MICO